jgi:RNA polymerase sigma-70 factor (ECF subfamily)
VLDLRPESILLMTETELIYKIRDDAAFNEIYDRYPQKLYFFFLKKTKSYEVCTELVQTVFIKCWQYREKLSADIPSSAQLFRMAKTALIDILRQRAASRTVSLEALHETIAAPAGPKEYQHCQAERITGSLHRLPPVRRRIIEYRLNGLSNKEIDNHLDISKKTVENQINKALQELRKYLPPYSACCIYWCISGNVLCC